MSAVGNGPVATPQVVLTLSDKVQDLSGLSTLRKELKSIEAYLTSIQRLATKSEAYARFQRTPEHSAQMLRDALKQKGLSSPEKQTLSEKEIAQIFGFKKADLQQHLTNFRAQMRSGIAALKAELATATRAKKTAIEADIGRLEALQQKWNKGFHGASAEAVGQFVARGYTAKHIGLTQLKGFDFPSYQAAVLAQMGKGDLRVAGVPLRAGKAAATVTAQPTVAEVRAAAGKVTAAGAAVTATVTGPVTLTIPATQIAAQVGPGVIPLIVPAGQLSGASAHGTTQGGSSAAATPPPAKPPPPAPPAQPPPPPAKPPAPALPPPPPPTSAGGVRREDYVWNGVAWVLRRRVEGVPRRSVARKFDEQGQETEAILTQDAEKRAQMQMQSAKALAAQRTKEEARARRGILTAEGAYRQRQQEEDRVHRSQMAIEKSRRRHEERVRKGAETLERREAQEAAARAQIEALRRQGYSELKQPTKYTGSQTVERGQLVREADGLRQVASYRIVRDQMGAVNATLDQTVRKLKATRSEMGANARGAISNFQHVSTWMTSVWALFGALAAVRVTLKSVIETGHQTARLTQVFQGVGGNVRELRNDTLGLAVAMGRSRDEAMESAIAWSRLGYTKAQVAQAVRVSLMAANVAELDAAEATKHLMAVSAAYGLQVGELASVLGEMNEISNNWNVTNKDMLEGLARTAAVARQAGLPLAELMGVIGATVGFTGQSGANIGNAMKSLTVALSNPTVQSFLGKQFEFSVRSDATGDIQDLSNVLRNLFVTYQELTNAERQYMLVKIAGKTQASRVAAMMDSYVNAQVLATNAQLDLNSAEEENALITATLQSQLAGLVAEYEKLAMLQMDRGPMQAMTAGVKTLKGMMALLNTPLGSAALTGVLMMGGAVAARSALSFAQASWAKSKAPAEQVAGYGPKTMSQLRGVGSRIYDNVMGQFAWWGQMRDRAVSAARSVVTPTPTPATAPGPRSRLDTWFSGPHHTGRLLSQRLRYRSTTERPPPVEPVQRRSDRPVGNISAWFTPLGTVPRPVATATPLPGAGLLADLRGRRERRFLRTLQGPGLPEIPLTQLDKAEAAMQRMAGHARNFGRFMAGSVAAFARMLPVLAVATAAFKVFDFTIEALGLSSATSAGKVDKLTQALEKSKAAADAAGRAARLYRTVAETLPTMRSDRQRVQAIEALQRLSGGMGLSRERADAVLGAVRGRRYGEASGLLMEGRDTAVQALGMYQAEMASDRLRILEEKERELERLRSSPFAPASAIANATKEVATASMDHALALVDEENAYEAVAEASERHLSHLKKTAALLASVDAIFTALPGESAGARATKAMYAEQAKMAIRDRRLEELLSEDQADREAERQREAEEEEARRTLERMRAATSMSAGVRHAPGYGPTSAQIADQEARLRAIQGRQMTGAMVDRKQEIQKLREAQRESRIELAGLEAAAELAGWQDRIGRWRENARSEAGAYDAGADPTDTLMNRQMGLLGEILDRRQRITSATTSGVDRLRALVESAELEQMLLDNTLGLHRRRNDLHREERQLLADKAREQQRGLLQAGPQEMLRKLAAHRLAGRGRELGLGEFLALTPEMRGELGLADPLRYSPEGRELRRQRGMLERAGFPLDETAQELATQRARQASGQTAGALTDYLPQFMLEVNAAANAARVFSNELTLAAVAVATFAGALRGVTPAKESAGGQPLRTAASGGAVAVAGS